MTTPVIFRKWCGTSDIIALFPSVPSSMVTPAHCLSYEHVGQHGGADYYGVMSKTVLATSDEYASLLKELETIYDDLKVYKRRTRQVYDEFLQEFHNYYKMVTGV